VGLEEKRKAYVVNLSGGQRQRLALGIALLISILFLVLYTALEMMEPHIPLTFSQFLARNESDALKRLMPEGRPARPATYHDSCHHKHVLKASEESRELVRLALGRDLFEMTGPAACCGFAGAFSVDHPEVAEALLADKLTAVEASGAELVALDCPGCLLQIRGGAARSGQAVEVRHTAEVLEAALRGNEPPRSRKKRSAGRSPL